MKLTVLTENVASIGFTAEHGLSYLIEDDIKILFDFGQSDMFLKNAEKLKISLDDINTIVLSHGHFDHGNGLKYLKDKKLICHPDVFIKRYRKTDNINIGLSLDEKQISERFHLIKSKTPFMISNNIFFLGEIPRINDFEAKTTSFVKEDNSEDFITDDSAIAIRSPKGLIIITGCGHAGICNTIEYAKKITGLKKINTVMGGFHLKENDLQTQETIKFFKKQNIQNILPSHCTELPALAEFYNAFKIKSVKVGMVFHF